MNECPCTCLASRLIHDVPPCNVVQTYTVYIEVADQSVDAGRCWTVEDRLLPHSCLTSGRLSALSSVLYMEVLFSSCEWHSIAIGRQPYNPTKLNAGFARQRHIY